MFSLVVNKAQDFILINGSDYELAGIDYGLQCRGLHILLN